MFYRFNDRIGWTFLEFMQFFLALDQKKLEHIQRLFKQKHKIMNKIISITGLSFFAGMASQAVTVVDFNPAVLAAQRTATVSGANSENLDLPYSTSALLFNGLTADSQKIYGGIAGRQAGTGTPIAPGFFGTQNIGIATGGQPGITIGVNRTVENTGTGTIVAAARGLLVWDAADWLVGGSDVFDNTSSFTYSVPAILNNNTNEGVHFLVRTTTGNYFRSAQELVSTAPTTVLGSDLTWVAFDETDLAAHNGNNPTGTAMTFTGVTAVGLVFDVNRGGTNQPQIRVADFQANLNIPEPSFAILMGLSALGFAGYRRRK